MKCEKLQFYERPKLNNPRLLLGFSGWMDGGEVSTGTLGYLVEKLCARQFAEIESEDFYIYSFPGTMETTALFRPHTEIKDGLVTSLDLPENRFYFDEENNLILFQGKEPQLKWMEFGDCIFSVCSELSVREIYFIGSVAGLIPHTREPRLLFSVSDEKLRKDFEHYGIKASKYEGPASFVTYLTVEASKRDIALMCFVATIPAYVQGNNPKCIESVTRKLAGVLGLKVKLDDLRNMSDDFEKKLTEVVQGQPELVSNIRKLEEDYDNEIFDNQMSDLKQWLEQQGIRVD